MDASSALHVVGIGDGAGVSAGRAQLGPVPVIDLDGLQELVATAHVDPEVFALRPDYRAIVVAVEGLQPGPADEEDEALMRAAQAAARAALRNGGVETLAQVAAWREAYRAFGAKPRRTRNSLEALLRRAELGLPRINRLTDLYNAISMLHQIPIGGEDLAHHVGAPRLIRATGAEPFETIVDGRVATEYPVPGEVVRCDGIGVTCRRWNWRQGSRTLLSDETTAGLFILDALEPTSHEALENAALDLTAQLGRLGDRVRTVRRLLTSDTVPAFASPHPPRMAPEPGPQPGRWASRRTAVAEPATRDRALSR